MKNITFKAFDIHENAKNKGWWDGKHRSEKEILMLVVSEIAEATEEVRNKKPMVYGVEVDHTTYETVFLDAANIRMRRLKPEGEAIELVDAVIRLLDWAGFKKWTLEPAWLSAISGHKEEIISSPLEFHFDLVNLVRKMNLTDLGSRKIELVTEFCALIQQYGKQNGWDMEELIDLKHTYNKTRGYKHGGKAL